MCRHLVFVLCFILACVVRAEELRGRVVHVSDGDTVTLEDHQGQRHVIRLATIDAPELGQPHGQAARKHLVRLALNKTALVLTQRSDAHGRRVGKLMLAPAKCKHCALTQDAGLAQLEAGHAWWYRDYKHEQTLHDQAYYEYAEFDARQRRLGLWQDGTAVAPWEWRKQHRPMTDRGKIEDQAHRSLHVSHI